MIPPAEEGHTYTRRALQIIDAHDAWVFYDERHLNPLTAVGSGRDERSDGREVDENHPAVQPADQRRIRRDLLRRPRRSLPTDEDQQ